MKWTFKFYLDKIFKRKHLVKCRNCAKLQDTIYLDEYCQADKETTHLSHYCSEYENKGGKGGK